MASYLNNDHDDDIIELSDDDDDDDSLLFYEKKSSETICEFNEMNLDKRLLDAIEALYWDLPTEFQESVIPEILNDNNQNVFKETKTATGKSCAILIGVINKILKRENASSTAVILTPTRDSCLKMMNNALDLAMFCPDGDIKIIDLSADGLFNSNQHNIIISTPTALLTHFKANKIPGRESINILAINEFNLIINMGFEDDLKTILSYLPKLLQRIVFANNLDDKAIEAMFSIESDKQTVSKTQSSMLRKPFKCKYCNHRAASKQDIQRHMKVHFNNYPNKCPKCSASYALRYKLEEHIAKYHNTQENFNHRESSSRVDIERQKNIHCSNPPKDHNKNQEMNEANKIEASILKMRKCHICQKHVISKRFAIHVRMHSGYRPFKCNQCDSKFKSRAHLEEHMQLHTGKHPFQCKKCSNSFRRLRNLKTHESLIHGVEYETDEC